MSETSDDSLLAHLLAKGSDGPTLAIHSRYDNHW